MFEKFAFVGEFQSQDDTLAIVEIGEQTQNMRMSGKVSFSATCQPHPPARSWRPEQNLNIPQILLDLNLPSNLFFDPVFQDLLLHQTFQRNDVSTAFCSCQVNPSEFPSTQWFPDLKVRQRFGSIINREHSRSVRAQIGRAPLHDHSRFERQIEIHIAFPHVFSSIRRSFDFCW
jgi:hypothetical protein